MPFNGTGTFTRVMNWVSDAVASINITASRVDTDTQDIANGLSNCVTRDGQGKPTAAIDWNGQNLTNVANFANTGNTTLGDASTDTLNVGNGGIVKDASGNVGVGASVIKGKLHVNPGVVTAFGALASSGLNIDNSNGGVPNVAQIGFGWTNAGTLTNATVAIAYVATSAVGNGLGYLAFGTRNVTTDTVPTVRVILDNAGDFYPFATNSYQCGTSALRWSNFNSVLGNFSGLVTASAGVTFDGANILANYVPTPAFTPTATFGGAAVGLTYGTQTGTATRVGDFIRFNLRLRLTSRGSSVGTLLILGLPTACRAGDNVACSLNVNNLGSGAGTIPTAIVIAGSSTISIQVLTQSTGGTAPMADTTCSNTSDFTIAGMYPV